MRRQRWLVATVQRRLERVDSVWARRWSHQRRPVPGPCARAGGRREIMEWVHTVCDVIKILSGCVFIVCGIWAICILRDINRR